MANAEDRSPLHHCKPITSSRECGRARAYLLDVLKEGSARRIAVRYFARGMMVARYIVAGSTGPL